MRQMWCEKCSGQTNSLAGRIPSPRDATFPTLCDRTPSRNRWQEQGNNLARGRTMGYWRARFDPFWCRKRFFRRSVARKDQFPMADVRKLGFGPIAAPAGGVLIVFADDNVQLGPRTRSALGSANDLVARAARAERFTGKSGSALDIVAPAGLKTARVIVIGTGKSAERKPQDVVKLGG